MAIFHMSAQVISRSGGRSCVAAAAYRSGAVLVDQRTGEVHDFTPKSGGVLSSEILAPADTPAWVFDRSELWNSVEERERRGDAQLAREFILALPSELDDDQRRELVTSFVRDNFVVHGMVADVAIHRPSGKNDGRNEHAHVMLTMRRLHEGSWRNKERAWNDRGLLKRWRESWATAQNEALAFAGVDAQVDHRSLQDRGSILVPTIHEGWGPAAAARRAQNDVIRRVNNEILAAEFELADAMAEVEAAQDAAHEAIERARVDGALRPAPVGDQGLKQAEGRLDGLRAVEVSGGASSSAAASTRHPVARLAVTQRQVFIEAARAKRSALILQINELANQHVAATQQVKTAGAEVLAAEQEGIRLRQARWVPMATDVAKAQRKLDIDDNKAALIQARLAVVSTELQNLGRFSFLRRGKLEKVVASLTAEADKLAASRLALAKLADAPLTYEDVQADLRAQRARREAAQAQEAAAREEVSAVRVRLTQAREALTQLTAQIDDATALIDEWSLLPTGSQVRMAQMPQIRADGEAEPEAAPEHEVGRPPGG